MTMPFENKSFYIKRCFISYTSPEKYFLNTRHGFESKLGLIGYKIMQTTRRNDTVIVNQENLHQTNKDNFIGVFTPLFTAFHIKVR